MSPLQQEQPDENLSLTNRLLLLMEADQDDMNSCINGEVLDAYNRSLNEAMDIVKKIRKSLMILQTGQRPGL